MLLWSNRHYENFTCDLCIGCLRVIGATDNVTNVVIFRPPPIVVVKTHRIQLADMMTNPSESNSVQI